MRNLFYWMGALVLLLGAGFAPRAMADAPTDPNEVYWFLPPDGFSFPRPSRMVILEKRIAYEQLPESVRKYVAPARQKNGAQLQVLYVDLTGDHRDDLILNTGLGGQQSENYAVFRMAGGNEQYAVVNSSLSGNLRLREERDGWLQLEMVTGNQDQRQRTLYAYNSRTGQYEIVRQELHDYRKFSCTVKKGEVRDPFELDLFAVEFERRLHKLAQKSPQLDEARLRAEKMSNGFYRFDYRTEGKSERAANGFTVMFSSKGKWKRTLYASCDLTTGKLYGIRPGKALYFHMIYTRDRGYLELLNPLIQPNFTFHIINRNRADDQLSLRITVDDKLLVAKTMKRDTGWFSPDTIAFPVQLAEGEHNVVIQAGKARYAGKFKVDSEHDIAVAEVRIAPPFDFFEKEKNGITFTCRKGPFED